MRNQRQLRSIRRSAFAATTRGREGNLGRRALRSAATKVVLIVAVGAAIAAAAPAIAKANQGDRYTGCCSFNGTRANLTGSATLGSSGDVLASVALQSATPPTFVNSSDGLLQTGEIKANAGFSSNCGTGYIGVMVEHKTTTGSYLCDMFFGSFGSNQRFASLHGSSGWSAYENGTVIDGPFSLGFSFGSAVARAEYLGTAPASYSFTWGPSGSVAWQRTTDGGASYTTITSANAANDGGWSIGAVPSPFTISR